MNLYLAGTFSRGDLASESGVMYALESFYSIRNSKRMIEILQKKNYKKLLLDSGAYSFMAQQLKGQDVKIDWIKYLEEYIDFINKYDIELFFELDIDSLVGLKEVEKYRRILEQKTGKKCIPVWHFSRGKDYFIQMCKEYDYVAFGGILTDGISTKEIIKYLPWFTKTAHKYNCKIHGLGLTVRCIEKLGLDSADSTTWLNGGRFGECHKFNGTYIEKTSFRNKRAKTKEIDSNNIKEWVKYQKYLDGYK